MFSSLSFFSILYFTVKVVTSPFSETQSLAPEPALNFKSDRKKPRVRLGSSGGLPPPHRETADQKRREKETNIARRHVMVQSPSLDGTMPLNLTENVTFGWKRQVML